MPKSCADCQGRIGLGRRLMSAAICGRCDEERAERHEQEVRARRTAHDAAIAEYREVLAQVSLANAPEMILERIRAARAHSPLTPHERSGPDAEALEALLSEVLHDDLITAAEASALNQYLAGLDLTLSESQRARSLVALANAGMLIDMTSPGLLRKFDERCFFFSAVELMHKRVVEEYRVTHHSVSIPVGRARYRYGESRGRTVVLGSVVEPVDRGVLYVTDHRVVFAGENQTLEFGLHRLAGLRVFENGLALNIANRQSVPTFRTSRDVNEAAAAVINTTVGRDRGTFLPAEGVEPKLSERPELPPMLQRVGHVDPEPAASTESTPVREPNPLVEQQSAPLRPSLERPARQDAPSVASSPATARWSDGRALYDSLPVDSWAREILWVLSEAEPLDAETISARLSRREDGSEYGAATVEKTLTRIVGTQAKLIQERVISAPVVVPRPGSHSGSAAYGIPSDQARLGVLSAP